MLNVVLPCNHVVYHSCVEDILRHARYIASFGRVAVDCILCGAPAIVSLLPTFGFVSDNRPLPRHVRAVRAEDGAGGEDDDGLVMVDVLSFPAGGEGNRGKSPTTLTWSSSSIASLTRAAHRPKTDRVPELPSKNLSCSSAAIISLRRRTKARHSR